MSAEELAELIEALVMRSDARYTAAMIKIQNDLDRQLAAIFKDLELDQDGYIRQNSANRRVMAAAEAKIQDVFSSAQYTSAISDYASILPKITALNVEYLSGLSDSFSKNRQFLKNMQAETIATVEKYVLQDGLQSQVVQPLVQIINQNINSGGQFSGFLKQLRTYVVGDQNVEGRALSYSRTYLRDSLFTYSRTYQQASTADLNLEWYMYSGGLMDKSRPFCQERAGKFYHHSEIESWASETWQGKKAGTTESSIFLFAGGWNCNHSIIPVSEIIVPKSDLDRIKKPAGV